MTIEKIAYVPLNRHWLSCVQNDVAAVEATETEVKVECTVVNLDTLKCKGYLTKEDKPELIEKHVDTILFFS